jgi:hypothetical protein
LYEFINCCSICVGLFVFELPPVAVLLAELLAADPSNCAKVDKLLSVDELDELDELPLVASVDVK